MQSLQLHWWWRVSSSRAGPSRWHVIFFKVSPNKVVSYEVRTGGIPESFLCTETIWTRVGVARLWTHDLWVPRRMLYSLGHTAWAYIHTYVRTCVLAYKRACMHTCMHAYIHTVVLCLFLSTWGFCLLPRHTLM